MDRGSNRSDQVCLNSRTLVDLILQGIKNLIDRYSTYFHCQGIQKIDQTIYLINNSSASTLKFIDILELKYLQYPVLQVLFPAETNIYTCIYKNLRWDWSVRDSRVNMVSAAALTWTAFLMGLAAAKNIGQGKILCKRYKMVSLIIMDPKDLVTN